MIYWNQQRFIIFGFITILGIFFGGYSSPSAADELNPEAEEAARFDHFQRIARDIRANPDAPEAVAQAMTSCVDGIAGSFQCSQVDLMAFMPLTSIGGGTANDIWGWTDPAYGKEYAILGRSTGTSFVDISDPENPVYLGNLPANGTASDWRDVKIYKNRAYIVSEAINHGLQVFDLRSLRNVQNPPVVFAEEGNYNGFGNAHNIVINEESGYAYIVGSNSCSGGLHVLNIQVPSTPIFVNCISTDGYVHDAQCVIFHGPDERYEGSEICFEYNEDTLTIVDVSRKQAPVQLSRVSYTGVRYTHQGWLTEDHAFLLLGDEEDETYYGHDTRTRVWDLTNLKNPELVGQSDGTNRSIDHNMYVFNDLLFQSNYTSGLQILDTAEASNLNMPMVGYFDTYPASNSAIYKGTWSNFPFFKSGVVIVSGINEGLFILKPVSDIDLPVGNILVYQKPGVMTLRSLIVANSGIGTLNWQAFEEASTPTIESPSLTACDTPADGSWLDFIQNSGQIPPGQSGNVHFSIDTEGLDAGTIQANICLTSDDPDEGLVTVPIVLNVIDWPEIFLPALFNHP